MEDKQIVLRRAKNAVIARDFNLAIRLYKSLLQEDVKNLEFLNALGNLYMKANDDQKALLYFQQILTFYPDNFEAMNCMGSIFRRMGKFNDSITILQKALETGINPAQVNYNLGFTYKFMGNNSDAIECFENVIAVNPTDVLAYNHLGAIYASEKDHAKAVATYKRGLQIDPNHPILQFNMAKSLQEMHDDSSAIQAYETALRAKPGWQDAVIAYSELLLAHRKTKTAGELVQNAIGLHPQDAGLYMQLGRITMRQSNFNRAAVAFETANRLASKNADTLRELAVAYEKLDRNEEAVASIKEARKIDSDDLKIKKAEASILLSANKLSEANSTIEEMSSSVANDPEILDLAGQYSILTGQDESAKDYEEKIKKISPEYISHLYSYATRYMEKGNYVEAKNRIKSFIDEKMKDVPAWILLGQIDEALGNPTDALDDYSTAVAFDPNNFLAGKLANDLGNKIDAEVNSMEEERNSSQEITGEEISLDEFDFGNDEDASIVPDEEISEGLSEDNNVDILGMDDKNSLFESGDDGTLDIIDPDEVEISEDEESEEETEEENSEEEDEEDIPEPFEDNSDEKFDISGLDNPDDSDFGDWEAIDPDSENDENGEGSSSDGENSEEENAQGENGENADDAESAEGEHSEISEDVQNEPFNPFASGFGSPESQDGITDNPLFSEPQGSSAQDAGANGEPSLSPEEPLTPPVQQASPAQAPSSLASQPAPQASASPMASQAGNSQPAPQAPQPYSDSYDAASARSDAQAARDSAKIAEQAAEIAKHISQSAEIKKAQESAEKAQQSAEAAMQSAERSWMAAQNAADMMQGAEQMEKHLEDKKNEMLEEIERAGRAENKYSKLMDKVQDILPKLTVALDDPNEIEKFRKEIDLFKRLRELGECLPLEQRAKFLTSRVRLLLDYIIARLSGRHGLLRAAVDFRRSNNLPEVVLSPEDAGLTRAEIVDVLKNLTGISTYLEDKDLSKALIIEAEKVIEKL